MAIAINKSSRLFAGRVRDEVLEERSSGCHERPRRREAMIEELYFGTLSIWRFL